MKINTADCSRPILFIHSASDYDSCYYFRFLAKHSNKRWIKTVKHALNDKNILIFLRFFFSFLKLMKVFQLTLTSVPKIFGSISGPKLAFLVSILLCFACSATCSFSKMENTRCYRRSVWCRLFLISSAKSAIITLLVVNVFRFKFSIFYFIMCNAKLKKKNYFRHYFHWAPNVYHIRN